jgi:hypothetical protein
MTTADSEDIPQVQLRASQIVAGTLLASLFGFLAFTVIHVQAQGPLNQPPPDPPPLTLVAVAFALVNVPLSFVLPTLVTRAGLRTLVRTNPSVSRVDLLKLFQTKMIVGLAFLEGAAFLGCLGYLIEGILSSPGIAALCALLMLARFPSRSHVRNWLERQEQTLQLQRDWR